jgi:hypothetical protein
MKIILVLILTLFLTSCGYFQEKNEGVYYIHETSTNHCFKVKELVGEDRLSAWIDCRQIPKYSQTIRVWEWESGEGVNDGD